MATTVAERVFLDTNVLLAATDPRRPHHRAALHVLQEWPAAGTTLYVSPQVLREYLAAATRDLELNGLGVPIADAVDNVHALRTRVQVLPENDRTADRLLRLVVQPGATGKQVHDANLIAVMLPSAVTVIVTANVKDFCRYADLVDVADLAEVQPLEA